MKKFYMFFKLRFATGLQYRMASVTALTTQLIWGLMECLAYKAIAEASGGNLPMNYSSIVTYIWLKEALLVLFNTWAADNDLFAMISNGNISYELSRPVSIYSMWFSRTTGARIAEAIMRCIPVLLCAFLMPKTYRMTLPVNGASFLLFLLTLFLAVGITVAFCMIVYMLCFFYDFAARLENGIDRSGRFSVREYYPTAVFSKKIFEFTGLASLCLYAEHSVSDLQRRSCRRGDISVFMGADLLVGDIDGYGRRHMETGRKEDHHTGRLN